MHTDDIRKLNGRSVLVSTTHDDGRNPKIGVRGSIRVTPGTDGQPQVELVVEYPDMKTDAARQQIVPLGSEDVDDLLRSERGGTYEYRLKHDFPDRSHRSVVRSAH